MKVILLYMGKTEKGNRTGPEEYENRIKRYIPFQVIQVPAVKYAATDTVTEKKARESARIMEYVNQRDILILLDEKGKEMTSVEFAAYLGKQFSSSAKQLYFVVGGAYGFDEKIRKRANGLLSLSKMTFPHSLARLFFSEQLYRALTILKNEPYHHD